jgi:sugar lactone lactonase YvrE
MSRLASYLPLQFAVVLALAGSALPAMAQDLDDLPVGTVLNFGPNLQTAAGGVCRQPEGITIDPEGNLYAASNSDSATTVGHVCVVDKRGRLVDIIDVPAGPGVPAVPGVPAIGLVGELFEDGSLYVLDQADNVVPHGRILKINPHSHEITTVASGMAFPNGMAEDRNDNIYIADSLLGKIFKLSKKTGQLSVWVADPLLFSTNPDQNVGANDLAFDADQHFLYCTNAGNRQVLRIRFNEDGSAGRVEVFADGPTIDTELNLPSPTALNFADGLQFDVRGNLYVMSNLTNEIEMFAPDGRLIYRYMGFGDNAFSFNASLVFKGRLGFISNMSATDGGVNSKLSVFVAPYPGLPDRESRNTSAQR